MSRKHESALRKIRSAGVAAALAAVLVPTPAAAGPDDKQLEALQQQLQQLQREIELLKQRQAQAPVAVPAAPGPASGPKAVVAKTEVQIYGSLIPFVDHVETSGATRTAPAVGSRPSGMAASAYTGANQPGRERVTVGNSNIGFRGSIPIHNGIRAMWQIEAGVPADGDPGSNTSLSSRNSSIGVSAPWGTLFAGNWDTPYKWMSLAAGPLKGLTTAEYGNLIGNPGFNVPATTTQSGRVGTGGGAVVDAAFDRRQGNSVQYWTPEFNGFSARFAYSVKERKSSSTDAVSLSPAILSGVAAYKSGGLMLRYGFEQHDDYFGLSQMLGTAPSATNNSSRDRGHKFLAAYSFGSTRLTGIYENLRYENSDSTVGNVRTYQRDAYYVTLEQKVGPGKAWVSYGRAGDGKCSIVGGGACQTFGLNANQKVFGYVWSLNQYADLFAMAYEVKTGESSRYGASPAPNNNTAPGADTRGAGLGLVVSF